MGNPAFHQLVRERTHFALTLSIVMMVAVYRAFIRLMAFHLSSGIASPAWSAGLRSGPVHLQALNPAAMSIMWRGSTTTAAFVGGFAGLVCAVDRAVMSKAVWVKTPGSRSRSPPMTVRRCFSNSLVFLMIWLASKLDTSPRAQAEPAVFDTMFVRPETGFGAATASAH